MSADLTFGKRLAKNNAYYDRFAENVAARTEKRDYSRAYAGFLERLPKPSETILDIGCGTGQHLRHFAGLGFSVIGVEPSAGMRQIVKGAGLAVIDGTFETLSQLTLPEISGIWCAASLLHVPDAQLGEVLANLANLLPRGGPLFLTVRLGEDAKWDRFDDEGGDVERFIQFFSEATLQHAINGAGLQIDDQWVEDSTWGRAGRWISMLLTR